MICFCESLQSSDGVALLAATLNHLDARADKCPRTVVATHFYELTLAARLLLLHLKSVMTITTIRV